ncbi:hypothetical protein, partial [Klebsiella quasipneumoniae]
AQELGRGIDPDNPLYQPGGMPVLADSGRSVHPEPMNASTLPQTAIASTQGLATDALNRSAGPDTGPVSGFDLALDL